MILPVNLQFRILLFGITAGIITGFIFDIYKTITQDKSTNKIIFFFQDILFWILTALVIYNFLLYFNYAYISMYIYLYIIFGGFLYFKIFRKPFKKVSFFINRVMLKWVRIVLKNVWFVLNLIIFKFIRKK
jgi:spore cortex biosynthesis protein YabQ